MLIGTVMRAMQCLHACRNLPWRRTCWPIQRITALHIKCMTAMPPPGRTRGTGPPAGGGNLHILAA